MSVRGKTITLTVSQNRTKAAKTIPLYQWDYGQKLLIEGVELPEYYEVHFSNQQYGDAVTVLGDSTGVLIPDSLVATGESIYVWLYLHDTSYDGETEYMGVIPVIKRAEPSDITPTPEEQSIITEVIAALNNMEDDMSDQVNEAKAAKEAAEDAQAGAEAAESAVEGYASAAATAKEAAETAQTAAETAQVAAEAASNAATTAYNNADSARSSAVSAKEYAETAATNASTSATSASGYATNAQNYASSALDAQTAAETAQGKAEAAQTAAEAAQAAAEAAEDGVEADALIAEGYAVGKQNGEDVASGSTYYHNNAKYYADAASDSATAAAGSEDNAEDSAEDAEAYAVGKRGGVDVESGDPAYENNAKYYAEEAATVLADKLDAPATAGTAGQVLTSDGEGGQAWADPSGAIDDTAGEGDTDVTWSADKIAETTGQLLNDILGTNEKVKAVNDLENDLIKDAEWKEGTVDPDTGGDAWSNSRLLSDYIVIDEYKTITVSVDDGYKYMIALINSAKTAIVNTLAWSTNKTVIDLSGYSTAKYIRLVLQKTDNTLPSSAEYVHATFATELLEVLDNKVSKGEVSYDTLANDMKGIFTYKYNEEPEMLNFANTNSLLLSNGNLLSYTGNYAVTDYIDCSNWRSMKYSGRWYYDGQCLAFYDENKTFISAFPGSTSNYHDYVLEVITIPQNAKYVRIAKCIIDTSVYIAVNIVPAKAGFKWIGKKWVCIGDSLTEVNTTAKKRYHDFVAENTGISVVNLGVSGTGYMNGGSGGNNPFRARVSSIPLDADVITIFGSFNDLGNDFPIGTKTDTGTSTVGGCINTTLDDICTRITLANIGIVTPTPWANAYPLDANTSGQAYVQLLKDICYARGIPCLDLNHCSQLRPWDASFKAVAYSNDNTGVHPDENGHRLIAPKFETFLDELLLV